MYSCSEENNSNEELKRLHILNEAHYHGRVVQEEGVIVRKYQEVYKKIRGKKRNEKDVERIQITLGHFYKSA